jgi:hypothetical protein
MSLFGSICTTEEICKSLFVGRGGEAVKNNVTHACCKIHYENRTLVACTHFHNNIL